MKKLIVLLVVALMLVSCDAFNSEECLEEVSDAFPNATIMYYDDGFTLVVIQDSVFRIVKTNSSFSTKITDIEILTSK